ncbi:amino acid dehydrogenase [Pseudomonas agarici]|uniref:Amino acid dehydrogenase n=1 Tax=Pseudomonas agarici TaxID=46677 RepID=A0A0X1SXU6_PSEAA|nr:D-amino acid dehydrogenase [Pseudomonas agarici]AMB84671.1 amino acid dehydrogenase [Pseudomonas agarici]NWB92565.1 D-amino acid dehydrogenase [Pseudomonas agarici]NWC07608.1 D-amino acid dehydrogenase [Pseudomonas agarici]SEL06078.1 D-amino-acid dehydrogenase [Pseudomonas agarici]
MDICVVGAGIVGLSSAWFLHRAGHRITVVEQASGPGMGAVAGNGAQLSYSYVQPLADPSLLAGIPKLLLDRSGPLRFTPQWSPQQWRWCMEFLAACRTSVSRQTTVELLALAAESRHALEAFMQEQHLDCDFTRTGKLVLYPDAESLDKAQRQLRFQAGLGSHQQSISAGEAVAIEPALAGYRSAFHGAIHTDNECVVDGLKLCREMARIMADEGVRFLFGHKVEGFQRQGQRIDALNLRHARDGVQVLHCEAVVLAAGAHSTGLLAQLGSHLPVYPLKGYSITLPITEHSRAPLVSITDIRRKTVFARIGERLRVAGMVELCGMDASIPAARIEQLRASTEALFGTGWNTADCQPWSGWRPATPTGRPVLECPAGGNLYLNTGHGALGMTLAFGSARRLVRLVEHTTG